MKENVLRHAVGIDFGGTFVKMALVSERGELKARARIATKEAAAIDEWLDVVAAGIESLCGNLPDAAQLSGIGVGVPGMVDYERGFIYELPNVPGWTDVHLAERLGERCGDVHVRIDNDVNAMALGECTFGAGRVYQHAVFLTLGTGVGGGLLINNQLYRGAYSMAGEIGHISIDMDGIRSPQGFGGLEQYVGNRRIAERAVKAMEQGRASRIKDMVGGDMSAVTPKVIAEAAAQGDELGLEVFDFVGKCLATAFASVAYLVQPQAFIIGGGVAQSGEVLMQPLKKHLKERLFGCFEERLEIKMAELGDDAGVIGSATLAMLE